MEHIKTILGVAAGCIGAYSFVPYFKDIFLRTTKPHSYTWLIWSLLQFVSAAVMIQSGSGTGVLPIIAGAILCGAIFIASLKYGTKNITVFDTVCLIGALVSLVVYAFMHNLVLSMILACAIDFIGFIPTFRKSWVEPKTETASTYIISAVSTVLALLALTSYSLTTTLYLITLTITDSVCWGIILARRR